MSSETNQDLGLGNSKKEATELLQSQMPSFEELGLDTRISHTVAKMGYKAPTEIQSKSIPMLLEFKTDLVAQAQTGTGKTAAFLLPLLDRLIAAPAHKGAVKALVLSPTRELASQIEVELQKFANGLGIKSTLVCGGKSYENQITAIKKGRPHIVVGTPGRMKDLINKGILSLKGTENVILDEADEMFNMGFYEDVVEIIEKTSTEREVWMFSATLPHSVKKVMEKNMTNPRMISASHKTQTKADIEQTYYVVKSRYKKEALSRFIDMHEMFYGMVFCETKRETDEVNEFLTGKGFPTAILHGDISQQLRDRAMERFKKGAARIMVCTDVAARGIDVNNLTHVINFGLPREVESYVHRIGRTGRAGRKGEAVTIIQPSDFRQLKRIERFTGATIEYKKMAANSILKETQVKRSIEGINGFLEAATVRGDEFKVDPSYGFFSDEFKGLSKDQVLKIMFSALLGSELRRIDEVGVLDELDFKSQSDRQCRDRRGQRRGRSSGRGGFNGRPRKRGEEGSERSARRSDRSGGSDSRSSEGGKGKGSDRRRASRGDSPAGRGSASGSRRKAGGGGGRSKSDRARSW